MQLLASTGQTIEEKITFVGGGHGKKLKKFKEGSKEVNGGTVSITI
jgi:hypothetical protein